jgi:hypothetical protein
MIPSYPMPQEGLRNEETVGRNALRGNSRDGEEHPFHGKLRSLYDHLNELKSLAQSQGAEEASAPDQGPDPAQVQAAQQMAAQNATAQVLTQQNALMQQAMQAAQQMDPIARFQTANKLRTYALSGTGGAFTEGEDYILGDRALAAKEYPNAFGDMGKRAQQILLASGMLDHRQSPSERFHAMRNFLQ